MSSQTSWLIEGRVILNQYVGILDSEILIEISKQQISMMEGCTEPIHFISDWSQCTGIAPNLSKLSEIMRHTNSVMNHPHVGVLTAFGISDEIIKFLGNVLTQVSKKEWYLADNYEDAVQYLARRDSFMADKLEALL